MYIDVDGKQVFASTGGKPFDNALPAVIFLHGSGLDNSFWDYYSRFFAEGNYAILALDLPGHSRSDGPPLTSIEAISDWLYDVVATLDINDISLVAHSQGCLVALEFGSRHADRLRSASLIASGLAMPVNPALIAAAESDTDAAISMMLSWGFKSASHRNDESKPGGALIDASRKVMQCNVPDALTADLKACDAYSNGKHAAGKLAVPVQVIIAEHDRMAPKKATDELVANLASPEVIVLQGASHMVPLEAPLETRELLMGFVVANNPLH